MALKLSQELGGTPAKSGDKSARCDGTRKVPTNGPRAKAVGAMPCGYPDKNDRGTSNPVK
jgi:hypothetical protein